MAKIAYVTVHRQAQVRVDVDELVERFGPKARTQAFLKDWAVGNQTHMGHTTSVTFDGFDEEGD